MELIKELLLEQRCYDIIDNKYYDELTEKEKKIKNGISYRMSELIFKNIPDQGYCDRQNICESGIEDIFINECNTRLEVLKFALKLKESSDIYEEIRDYISDEYNCELWSSKSLRVYEDCLEKYLEEFGPIYEQPGNAAACGAQLIIEQAAIETIYKLAELAEDLEIEEDEEE